MKTTKAQAGLELIMLVSYTLLMFSTIYIVVLQSNFNTIKEKRNIEAQKVADWIGYEIDIATGIGTGYSKNITFPENLVGETYNIMITHNLVIVNSSDTYSSPIFTPNITGTIHPGDNKIENIEGKIYANQ